MWDLAKIKELALENIVLAVFALITLLLLVVWQAVPSSVWDTVSEATPKRALWALLGLESIAICVLVALALDNRRKGKDTPPEPVAQPLLMFGVYWDENQNPLCPADRLPLSHYTRQASTKADLLHCARCGKRFWVRHDTLGNLSLGNAKQMIRDGLAR